MTARRGWRLGEERLRAWVDELLAQGRRVIAPVEDAGLRTFQPVSSRVDVSLAPGKSRWSPKEHLFPRTEELYAYTLRGDSVEVRDPALDEEEIVLFGLRPCDAAGLLRLDQVFLGPCRDPFYANRRARTTVVSLACAGADPECFCTVVGGSPAGTEGSDLLLDAFDGLFLVSPITERGEALVAGAAAAWAIATAADWAKAEERRLAAEASITAAALDPSSGAALEAAFADPIWESFGQRCLGCCLCASVCPSCSCFDVHQEGSVWGGSELRCWDGCTLAGFTRHASGHNPRSDQAARFRQRLLHKLAYRGAGGEQPFRCVGCGRCITLCPAGVDIHAAVRQVLAAAGRGGDDAR